MAQKQKHDSDSNMGTYDALVLRLLHMGQELLGQKHGVFDRFSQEITLATQGKVHLTFNHQHPEQPSPAELAYRFPVQFKERFYGILSIAPEPADSFSPSIALVTASLLAQLCGWLLYAIEVAALMPELGKPYTHAYQARRTLTKRELEALALMCQGHDQQAIAGILHISPATVRKYREHIYAQFDVHEEHDIWFAAFSVGLFYPVDGLRPHILPFNDRR